LIGDITKRRIDQNKNLPSSEDALPATVENTAANLARLRCTVAPLIRDRDQQVLEVAIRQDVRGSIRDDTAERALVLAAGEKAVDARQPFVRPHPGRRVNELAGGENNRQRFLAQVDHPLEGAIAAARENTAINFHSAGKVRKLQESVPRAIAHGDGVPPPGDLAV
jgi:hypothetical protein